MPKHSLPRHITTTHRDRDWQEVERFSRSVQDYPVCTTITGDPGAIASGSPGALSTITWSPPTNPLFDTHNMLGGAATTDVRIPKDGFYSFWMAFRFGDNPINNRTEFVVLFYTAKTSETGYGAPSFSEGPMRCSRTFDGSTHITADAYFTADFRGVELHQDDLVQFGVKVYGTQTLNAVTVSVAEFRYLFPIPQGNV